MARNRYGWQKRAKELARKEKSDEKMKRRQGKSTTPLAEDTPMGATEGIYRPDETASPEEDPAASFRHGQG
ncbi:MAG: hypothetical protein ACOZFS_13190 [Thermodesulfobacteriota bacterium]